MDAVERVIIVVAFPIIISIRLRTNHSGDAAIPAIVTGVLVVIDHKNAKGRDGDV